MAGRKRRSELLLVMVVVVLRLVLLEMCRHGGRTLWLATPSVLDVTGSDWVRLRNGDSGGVRRRIVGVVGTAGGVAEAQVLDGRKTESVLVAVVLLRMGVSGVLGREMAGHVSQNVRW